MQKNVAGQRIGVQMVSASDGSAFTGSVTVYVTGDAGTQAVGSVGSGVCTHEGNGYHSYAPAQAETNYDLIAFTFTGSGAVPVTVQIYTAINPVTSPPTASANATAVRSELATELGRIDVATSTRLASANYTAPDNASVTAIKAKTDNLPSDPADASEITAAFTEIKGAAWSSSTDTLEAIRNASGSSSITVAPLQATAPNRVAGTEIATYINDTSDIGPIVVTDGDGNAVDLSSYTLKICIERKETGTIDDNITPTISGAGNNQVTFTPTAACVNSTTPRKWSLRRTSNGQVFAFGDFKVEWPARLS